MGHHKPMFSRAARQIATAFAASFSASLAAGQAPAQPPPRSAVQVNPVGILQFGPTVEVVHLAGRRVALAGLIRFASLGLLANELAEQEGDVLYSAWTVGAGLLIHEHDALSGWFGGPRVEAGRGRSALYTSSAWLAGAEFGRRWIHGSGYLVGLSAVAGMFFDVYQHRTLASDRGTELYPLAALLLNFGYAY